MKLEVTAALAFLAAVGCGQTARDPAGGSGGAAGGDGGSGATGGVGSGGTSGTPAIECAGKHWTRLAVPAGGSYRQGHGAARWTDQILIWGGAGAEPGEFPEGGWRVFSNGTSIALPAAGAPSPRGAHAVDVLGNRLLVFGGGAYAAPPVNDGASLNLETDVWSALPNPGALLPPRYYALSGAAGGRWLVWGGLNPDLGGTLSDAALFDPATGSWIGVAGKAPLPTSLSEPRALARGGTDVGPAAFGFGAGAIPGYGYDPVLADWWEMPSTGAPSAREGASLTWSASTSEFIAWGGYDDTGARADGARYSTVTGTWKSMTTADAPSPRYSHYAAVLGTKLVVWGGREKVSSVATGGVYDLATDTWGPLPTDACAPPALIGATFTAFGDGKRALLWGGVPEPQSYDEPGTDQGWLLEL